MANKQPESRESYDPGLDSIESRQADIEQRQEIKEKVYQLQFLPGGRDAIYKFLNDSGSSGALLDNWLSENPVNWPSVAIRKKIERLIGNLYEDNLVALKAQAESKAAAEKAAAVKSKSVRIVDATDLTPEYLPKLLSYLAEWYANKPFTPEEVHLTNEACNKLLKEGHIKKVGKFYRVIPKGPGQ